MSVEGVPVLLASLSLVIIALGVSRWYRLGIERDVVVAATRAAVQLLIVGGLFTVIFESSKAMWWAWLWVGGMVVLATGVVVKRAKVRIDGLLPVAGFTIAAMTAISLAVTFGFGVIELNSVELVVIAGITIGNAVPSAVLGVTQAVDLSRDRVGEIEAVLSMGFERRQVVRFMGPRAARSAILPQVERTKVVGLIALPGAMTGLLLAGVDPIDAVAVQLLVMYLVLGTAVLSAVTLVAMIVSRSVSDDLRVESWVRRESDSDRTD